MRTLLILCSVAVLTVCASCATNSLIGYNYYVTVKNTGPEPITDSTVTSAKGFWDGPGYLSPGARSSIAGPFKYPYADSWTVSWQTAKGEKFTKTLDLTRAFSKPLQGQLVFLIDSNNNLSHTTQGFSER